jgi:hypothetical protein
MRPVFGLGRYEARGNSEDLQGESVAQKEDILEQVVEEFLTHEGYFVQHNTKYRPRDFNQTPSDIDVLAVNPLLRGPRRVFETASHTRDFSGVLAVAIRRDD